MPSLSIEQIETFIMVFIRVSAIVFAVPVLGSRYVPVIVKVGLAVTMSMLIYPAVPVPPELASVKLLGMIPAIVSEIMIGVVIGVVARIIFEGIQMGGQVIGFQMGFGIVNVFDPVSGANFSVIAQIKNLLATLLFLGLGLHYWFIRAMVLSFRKIPLFHCFLTHSLLKLVFDLSSNIFLIAVKIAAPVMATLLFTSVALGIIARGVQGMNILIVGFPLKIAAGLFGIAFTPPMFVIIVGKIFGHLEGQIFMILKLGYVP